MVFLDEKDSGPCDKKKREMYAFWLSAFGIIYYNVHGNILHVDTISSHIFVIFIVLWCSLDFVYELVYLTV